MSNLLDSALACAARGWFVHPLQAGKKIPASRHGKDDATRDEVQIRKWWEQNPNFNVGVSCAPSGLCVIDADHGLSDEVGFDAWRERNGLPTTYAVRSGRRPEFGVQMYFEGHVKDGRFEVDGVSGDIKSAGGLVLAAGSIHPDTREQYVHLVDAPVAGVPLSFIDRARKVRDNAATEDDGAPITSNRNTRLTSIAGKMRNAGMPADELEAYLLRQNERRCQPPLDEDEVQRIAANVSRYKTPEETVEVTIGGASKSVGGVDAGVSHARQEEPILSHEWRSLFHSRQETENSPDPQFLIRDFLQEQSITGLIGPARARKSIITVNIIHALLTGEPLFGKFEVTNKPERCVYLCPESGLLSLSRRMRNMGLSRFVGESLFYSSMNSALVELDDSRIREGAKGAVVFVDTLVRFFGSGEENSATDMKLFFRKCNDLINAGARAVFVLHHTAKQSEGLRLESGRGSGDFGGSLTAAWGTTLDNFEDAYNSASLLVPVKERDFRAESFKVQPSGDDTNFFLQYVDGSDNSRVQVGAKKKAGSAQATAFARANPTMSAAELRQALATQGIQYSERTCGNLLRTARSGVSVSEG